MLCSVQTGTPIDQCFEPIALRTARGWTGGAMALGKLPVPRHPTNLD